MTRPIFHFIQVLSKMPSQIVHARVEDPYAIPEHVTFRPVETGADGTVVLWDVEIFPSLSDFDPNAGDFVFDIRVPDSEASIFLHSLRLRFDLEEFQESEEP